MSPRWEQRTARLFVGLQELWAYRVPLSLAVTRYASQMLRANIAAEKAADSPILVAF